MKIETASKETVWTFTKAELVALLEFACVDVHRHNRGLDRLHLDAGKGVACTTDGHRLIRATCKGDGNTAPVQLGLVALRSAAKSAGKKSRIEISTGLDVATVRVDANVTPLALDHKSFPPYEQVIPFYGERTTRAKSFGINARYLASLRLVALATEQDQEGITIEVPCDDCSPIRVDAKSAKHATDWTAIIMPQLI